MHCCTTVSSHAVVTAMTRCFNRLYEFERLMPVDAVDHRGRVTAMRVYGVGSWSCS